MSTRERPPVSEAVEDSLKAIYARHGRGADAVTATALADRLGVTPASASAMSRKLAELGLVAHVPYRGVVLTDDGRRIALVLDGARGGLDGEQGLRQ